jgi:hypothetical protein
VAIHVRGGDYSSDERPTTLGGGRSSSRSQPARPVARPADAGAIDEFLHLLARAVQQFHTYPSTSPLCQSAIDACQRALVTLEAREHVDFRVGPHELIVDEAPTTDGLVQQELARRLHAASVAQVTIERQASARELARFCFDLVQCDVRTGSEIRLLDLLEEHGVNRITLRAAHRPQVLAVRPPSEPLLGLIDQQRARRDELFAGGGPVDHMYPPDKGWVRVDPATNLDQISLVDLALLSQDPSTLAGMLVRLTEDDVTEGAECEDALSRKFSDVTTLFAALDPRVSRVMFGKLARAVLDLDPGRRQTLLRKTILPGLLDGKIDGTVLRDFPDLELAESLCLLLDLETAAPEVVTTALARLELPAERQASVLPLVQSKLDERETTKAQDSGLDAHARRLVRIDREKDRSFAEFAAFDLSLDPSTVATLAGMRTVVATTDALLVQLECLGRLVRLEPNPEPVQRFVYRGTRLLGLLERDGRWQEMAAWLTWYRQMASGLREPRPDVADVIAGSLTGFCTTERALRLIELAERDAEGHAAASAIVQALGADVGPALLDGIRARTQDSRNGNGRVPVRLLCDHAPLVAPALVAALGSVDNALHRVIARVLGLAGAGYEVPLGKLLASNDEQTVREALRSLAKIGTPRAAALVGAEVEKNRGWLAGAAEQTLWHFPRAESDRQVRELLGRREFVVRHPQVAERFLGRVAQSGATNMTPILERLVPLRYRFWSPSLVRVARQARTMLAR